MKASASSEVLQINPLEVGIAATPELPRVWGLLMDTTYARGGYSLVALADGTTSLYTTTGGGMIGGGEHDQVVAATLAALRVVEAHLDQLPPSSDDTLPPVNGVVLRALTYDGQRAVVATEQDLGEGRHPQAEIFHAAHDAITELRLIEDARQRAV
ncbi:MAG: hypothetical protein ABW156_09085 [Jiangellaceae bacterium]